MSFAGERPTTGSSAGGVTSVNMTQLAGTAVSVNNGAADNGTQRVAIAPNTAAAPFNVTGAVARLSTSLDWKYAALTGGITDTADVVLKTAAGASLYNTLNSLQFVNKAAAVSTEVVVKDGSTVIWRGWAPQSTAAVTQLPTVQIYFDPPLQSSANTALNFACITTASATYVNAQGSVVG